MIGGLNKYNQFACMRTQALLVAAPKRYYQMQRLHV